MMRVNQMAMPVMVAITRSSRSLVRAAAVLWLVPVGSASGLAANQRTPPT